MPTRHLIFSALLLCTATAHAAGVDSFSPQGTVKGVRQVAVRFSEPMVPFGDPRLVEPFEIDCAERGQARWADGRNWVFDFARDLPAGVVCRFTLKPDLKTLAGHPLAGEKPFAFSTGGPAIREGAPYEGSYVDEEQIFILGLDAPVKAETISQTAYCKVGEAAEKIGVELIGGAARKQVLAQRAEFLERYYSGVFKDANGNILLAYFGAQEPGSTWEKFLKLQDAPDSPLVVLKCKQRFPNDAEVALVWDAGIRTASGIATTEPQTLRFYARNAFTASFSCDRVNQDAKCTPVLPMVLSFTAPVARKLLAQIRLQSEHGKTYQPILDADVTDEWLTSVRFQEYLPEQTQFTIHLPEDFKDDAGRALQNAASFPLKVATDEAPPLAKFPANFGIVEWNAEAALPVTLRNLDAQAEATPASGSAEAGGWMAAIKNWYRQLSERIWGKPAQLSGATVRVADARTFLQWMARVREAKQYRGHWDDASGNYVYDQKPGDRSVFTAAEQADKFALPKPHGAKAFEVMGIPFKQPGFYVVELASPRLGAALHGENKPYYVQTAALVTNLSAHLQLGRESSLVWVTTLDKAQPVANAQVVVSDCSGEIYWQGETDNNGIANINQPLAGLNRACNEGYFVTAQAGEDLTFVLSTWEQGISPWRFDVRTGSAWERVLAHSVFDRTLFRAGETVHMKHFAREHARNGINFLASDLFGKKLTITHSGSDETYELDLAWREDGTAENIWTIPAAAKQGSYAVSTVIDSDRRTLGSFRVEQFRLPTMRAVLQPALTQPLIRASSAQLDVQVNYLAGGGAGDTPIKVRSMVEPRGVHFADYNDFTFANGAVKEGVQQYDPYAWYYEGYAWQEDNADAASGSALSGRQVTTQNLTLDKAGGLRVTLPNLPLAQTPQSVLAEVEYQDANGERLSNSTRLNLWHSDVLVGLKPDDWAVSKDKLKIQALTVDTQGQPLAGQQVILVMYQRIQYSHRKRLLGGFYAYESHSEIKKVGDFCSGKTDAKGRLYCAEKSPVDGNVILQAQVTDASGQLSHANREVWVAGKSDWWFDVSNEDRMDLLAERKHYQPGETATLQVRMPFREATALITVAREGVMETTVQKLSGKLPVVQVPIKDNYAPNMFVSVLAVRGRVNDVQPTALVDLGRPAFKLGIAELKVGWQAHELKVAVTADKPAYQPRENAQIKIKVTRANGEPLAAGTEIALAAVDEGLLELQDNNSWDLLTAMMGLRGLEVSTSTAQLQVIGKRHYGKKAVPHGGGGGNSRARELFDTLLLWQARSVVDANGEATISVPLNDSLTAFKIVAIAHGGADTFGSGAVSIRSSQELMLFAGLPPLVREQDQFAAGFTVRNASDQPQDISLHADVRAKSGAEVHPLAGGLPALTATLAAGESRLLQWEVSVPLEAERLLWTVTASSGDKVYDQIKTTQKVIQAVPVRVLQATLAQIDQQYSLPVAIPADAIPHRGGVRVHLQNSLTGSLASVREWMRYYQYSCVEQQLSSSVVLRDELLWQALMDRLPAYMDGDGLIKYFADMRYGDEILTAYILSISHEAGWNIPDYTRQRLRDGLLGFVEGRVVRGSALPTADLSLRKLTALEAITRYEPLEPRWLDSIEIAPNLWPTSGVLDWLNIATRSEALEQREARVREARQIIRSRLNFQGTTMGFSTERSDYLWWLMIHADVNANRAVLALLDADDWQEDLPRMLRGALGRQQRGAWQTTVANAWGTLAVEKFAARFESTPVAGITRSQLDGGAQEVQWSDGNTENASDARPEIKQHQLEHRWPASGTDLVLTHDGAGKPWALIQSRAAVPLRQAFSSGYTIKRSITPIEQKTPDQYSKGDVLRVRLELESQSDMTWVVVNDPIPAGASILGTGLGKDSAILSQGEVKQGFVYPAFEERKFDAFHAYYEYVPKGVWTVEYTLRLNNSGDFNLPPARVEAMYAPEMFGELPLTHVQVLP